jgi:hypothetical protein
MFAVTEAIMFVALGAPLIGVLLGCCYAIDYYNANAGRRYYAKRQKARMARRG